MLDRNLPVDEIEAANIADEILINPPVQGFLTISNALQWRLQYGRVIERAGQEEGYVLVTQKYIGEPTEHIQNLAPKTWNYLTTHSEYLDARKSKIYKKSSRFSIFGVGSYTFAPWKIAICGLYKKLDFRLVGITHGKPTVFDDTVYLLSFEDEQVAHRTFTLLTSSTAIDFYCSLIFWDEKRPIKSSILNSLDLTALTERLGINF